MKRLVVISPGPDKGKVFTLDDGTTLVIGRGAASKQRIQDLGVSRIHCVVEVNGSVVRLIDNEDSAGTWVKGQKISSYELEPGEIFTIGNTQLAYKDLPDDDPTVENTSLSPKLPVPEEYIGKSFGTFRVDAVLATGSSSVVFTATDTDSEQQAALKLLILGGDDNDESKRRFVRAMKTMLPVRHPNIVRLHNAGWKGEVAWCAMELIEGESATEVIRRIGIEGMLDWKEAFRVAVHVGRGLQEAFERKIIHRNLSPSNILVRTSDRTYLLGDLMLAKALEGTLADPVTMVGQRVGALEFMSPERMMGDSSGLDHRSDLYELGATLYAVLTGRPPFESDSEAELINMICKEQPRRPKEVHLAVNDQFEDVVLRLLAKDRHDRYQNPLELLKELDHIGQFAGLSLE